MKKIIVLVFSIVLLGSCQKDIEGCTDTTAVNYNSEATIDDGSCIIIGCTDPKIMDLSIDSSYAPHPDAKSHTGMTITHLGQA